MARPLFAAAIASLTLFEPSGAVGAIPRAHLAYPSAELRHHAIAIEFGLGHVLIFVWRRPFSLVKKRRLREPKVSAPSLSLPVSKLRPDRIYTWPDLLDQFAQALLTDA